MAPRLPVMSIRRLTFFNKENRDIKGQVINVPIDVQETLQSLPRNISVDMTIEVHLKRRLLFKPTYRRDLEEKANVKAWLHFLVNTELYKHHGVRVDEALLLSIPEDPTQEQEHEQDNSEIEEAVRVTDPDDAVQWAAAVNSVKVQPLAVYHSDHKANITMVTK